MKIAQFYEIYCRYFCKKSIFYEICFYEEEFCMEQGLFIGGRGTLQGRKWRQRSFIPLKTRFIPPKSWYIPRTGINPLNLADKFP
jgi:hypothetical protein